MNKSNQFLDTLTPLNPKVHADPLNYLIQDPNDLIIPNNAIPHRNDLTRLPPRENRHLAPDDAPLRNTKVEAFGEREFEFRGGGEC
jgi:hypothetical protein